MINTSTTTTTTSTGTRLAPALDRKLADTEQPLFDVVNWYGKAFAATNNLESDRSVNEDAALWLGIEEFKSEAEIGTRPCQCTRPDPNVCECWETLKAARAALAHAPTQEEARPIREEVADHVAEVKRELANRMREALRSRGDKVIPHHIGLMVGRAVPRSAGR